MRTLIPAGLVQLLVIALGSPALAAWPSSPFTNLPVCTTTNDQTSPQIVPDGGGGAIVTWEDGRSSTSDVYARLRCGNRGRA